MIATKNMVKVLMELEYEVGKHCYNRNSYNGWTGEEGLSYRYPVHYCKTKKDLEEHKLSKTRNQITNIEPYCIQTIKYKFGSNDLFIGNALVDVLSALEERYNLDFNLLEVERIRKEEEKEEKEREELQRQLEWPYL